MEPFIGELRLFGFNYAPRGWALCDGSLMPINQNQALFSLLGTMYGGNGTSTFGLPDLRGRVPLGAGQTPGGSQYQQGQSGGTESVTLTVGQLPSHSHQVQGSAQATGKSPANLVPGFSAAAAAYGPPDGTAMNATMVGMTGNGQPIPVVQPYQALVWCIAVEGIFPSRQ
ncbi:phage tail protein [Occultella glacieicola]|nr:tail fiber protein [Occultella glacieicola]